MKVCEIEGSIQGFEFSFESGFLFNGEWIRKGDYGYIKDNIQFPYNNGDPKEISLDKVINRRFRLIVEIIEDKQDNYEENGKAESEDC